MTFNRWCTLYINTDWATLPCMYGNFYGTRVRWVGHLYKSWSSPSPSDVFTYSVPNKLRSRRVIAKTYAVGLYPGLLQAAEHIFVHKSTISSYATEKNKYTNTPGNKNCRHLHTLKRPDYKGRKKFFV